RRRPREQAVVVSWPMAASKKPGMAATRRGTSTKRKRGAAPRARRTSSPPLLGEIARLRRELDDALAQQTASGEVLRVISRSSGELTPVFRAMLENATRLCEAKFGVLFLTDGEGVRNVAAHNVPPALVQAQRGHGRMHPPAGTPLGDVIRTK